MPNKSLGLGLFDESRAARRRLMRGLALAAVALFLLRVAAEWAPALRRPDLSLLDAWQALRGTDKPSAQIAIVALDEKSIAKIGPPAWPRSEYAPLLDVLSAAGARVVGFDITFGTLDREAERNAVLAAAMQKAGNVVFGYEFTELGDPSPPSRPPSDAVAKTALRAADAPAVPPASALIEPEPVLAAAASSLGHVTTVESEDGRIRVAPLVVKHGDRAYPSLALQLARAFAQVPADEVALEDGVVSVGPYAIPVSATGEALLAWPAAGEEAFPRYSFLDVVRGDVPPEAFRGKVVLVAGTAPGLDDRDFPFASEAPGVLVYAAFLDNVFRSDFVRAPSWAFVVEWLLFLALCVAGVFVLPRVPTPALLAGGPALALLFLGGSAFLFVQKGLWLKSVYPLVALLVMVAATVALRLRQSEKQTVDVAAESLENQKLLALSFQEKGMLDMALAAFNKLPFTPDMKGVYLNLALDFENRAQRDKAFLLYKKLFDADPHFADVAVRLERLGQATGMTVPSLAAGGATSASVSFDSTAISARVEPPSPGGGTLLTHVPATAPADLGATYVPNVAAAPASPSGTLAPGSRFGRYQVEKHLGRGGMGDVYLVTDTVLGRRAALKTIRPDTGLASKQLIEMRQRFYREAQTAGKLTHPNIVTVFDVGEELGTSYIVMEFIEGTNLADLMETRRLTIPQLKHVLVGAATGLDFAHQSGVFHRDVKPDNIMITPQDVVKVMDFGIARVVDSDLTKTGSVMGTPSYMSPEQFSGKKVDARTDIFSLGVILYELLAGRKPFEGDSIPTLMFAILQNEPAWPSTIDTQIHPAWDEILRRSLAKDPAARFATAMEFAQAVHAGPDR